MTIEQIMLLASTCQTPRDWSEFRKHITALVAQARDEEAEACAEIAKAYEEAALNLLKPDGAMSARATASAIRARIAARAEGGT
jgi:hypothetical protein